MSAKVLFVGIDSGDEALLHRWIDEGALPSLAALRATGAWAPVVNPARLFSGAVWPTLFTGVGPARHGSYFYNGLTGYRITGVRNPAVRHEPFWDILSRKGRRVALFDVPYANVRGKLNGIQLVDWITHDKTYKVAQENSSSTDHASSYPSSLATEVLQRFGRDTIPSCETSNRSRGEFKTFRDLLLDRVRRKTDLSLHYLAGEPWDLFMTVFADSHCVGHECWHLHDPSHPRHDAALARSMGDPIKDVYVAIDAAIGRLVEQAGPDAMTFVFGSHGMGPNYVGSFVLDHILSLLEDGSAQRNMGTVHTLNRAWAGTPAALRTLLRPMRERWKGQVREVLVTQHRRVSRCFAFPTNDDHGGIRVNLAGREPDGRVQPGAEYDEVREQLTRDLLDLVDANDGQPIVRAVVDYEDVYPDRDPYNRMLYNGDYEGERADFLVVWNKPYITDVRSPKFGTRDLRHVYQGSRMGDHRNPGLALCRGSSIQPGRLADAISILDIAPTLAARLGVSLPDVDGTPIPALSDAIGIRREVG